MSSSFTRISNGTFGKVEQNSSNSTLFQRNADEPHNTEPKAFSIAIVNNNEHTLKSIENMNDQLVPHISICIKIPH